MLRAAATSLGRRPAALRRLSTTKEPLTLASDRDGVRTVTLNNPSKYNGWNQAMLLSVHTQFVDAAQDDAVKAVILTGAGDYYCAGVDLASSLTPMMPAALHEMIYRSNKKVFDTFLDFPKPLCVAVNGPNIGAAVTTATLADGVVASERATFSTPFARLGVTPEGCSSVHFEYLMGAEHAARMLGDEGWAPTGAEAAAAGLVDRCVPHDELLDAGGRVARAGSRIPPTPRPTAASRTRRRSRPSTSASRGTSRTRSSTAPARRPTLRPRARRGPRSPSVLIATRPAWSLLLP
ncbi:enoyl-CoA delta-isomerase 2 [Aureococcus anophagefferens]|nr:enoyl-CoA delta-isomerase 2 [Aureococcus anophagefferens]